MTYWAIWAIVGFQALAGGVLIVEGLRQPEPKKRSYGPSDVLVGCLVLVVVGFAFAQLWNR